MSTPNPPTVTADEVIANEERMARALELLAKDDEREANKLKRQAEREAAKKSGEEEPNTAHLVAADVVRYLTAVIEVNGKDADAMRGKLSQLTVFLDGFSSLPNLTTSSDYRATGSFIKAAMPKLPVKSDGKSPESK